MTTYAARIQFATAVSRPDDFIFSAKRYPEPDFIVCRNVDGSRASVYLENAWNFSAYHPEQKNSYLYFNCWDRELNSVQKALIDEAKWIVFLLIYMKRGQPLSYGTLSNYLKHLKPLMRYCSERSICLSAVLSDAIILRELCSGGDTGKLGTLVPLLKFLYELGDDVVGFPVLGVSATVELQAMFREYTSSLKQHAPIPTRIYSSVITTLSTLLQEFETVSEAVLEVAAFCLANSTNRATWGLAAGMLEERGLAEYFKSRGVGLGVHGLSSLISETLYAAVLQVQCFTGMRSAEVRSLSYDCLTIETRDGRDHYIIRGHTTKLNHGRKKEARWVTSNRGKQAVHLAQKIAKVMRFGVPKSDDYLIVNTLLGGNTSQGKQPLTLILKNFPNLQQRLCLPIAEGDIQELENIDPHRAWRSEDDYQIGAPWPLRGHQFRRSLALYAQRSGIVTLPTLRRQLQHITEEMSRYYARGSAFATDFIGSQKDHIGIEWRKTQPISQYLGYAASVIFSDDELFGGHGNWIKHRLKGGDIILHDRKVTLERFKKGQMAFRETAIGGCVSTQACDSGILDVLDLACLKKGCKNLVGSPKKLERAIAVQRKRVAALEALSPVSPEYRSERSDLEVLLSAKDSLATF
ncbi:hypothetical protein [Chromobacterium violaceum]|uniref:hypothetical protein n=1 Tax=Chromobacterium violaceum TaxID=536 RepID=UPI0015F86E17|nr:hypothetical protein [Chromobacterium violaceum]MBA8735800.1 hypothetical protein [Chromobacterium violaceum]